MSGARVLPAMRRIDITPIEHEGEAMFLLRDVSRIAPRSLALSQAGCFILAHMDGESTYADVQHAFAQRFGQFIAPDDIETLVTALDDSLLLQTPRFHEALTAVMAEYADSDLRDGRDKWANADALRKEVLDLLDADGPVIADVRGIIAPHLDYERGRPCYVEAYSLLKRATPAERYVILGTNHFGRSSCVVATGKDFLTPLGRVATDRAFLAALESRLGESLCRNEFDHLHEHSVELQVHVLQAIHGRRPFTIVPVLCPDPSGPAGTAPRDGDGPDLGDFADALGELLAQTDERTVVIAGADFSHIGRHFGADEATTPETLASVGLYDRRLLGLLEARCEEQFVETVRRSSNRTNICSVGNVYTLMRALPDARCEVLNYHQAVNMEADMHVTCAAAVLH